MEPFIAGRTTDLRSMNFAMSEALASDEIIAFHKSFDWH